MPPLEGRKKAWRDTHQSTHRLPGERGIEGILKRYEQYDDVIYGGCVEDMRRRVRGKYKEKARNEFLGGAQCTRMRYEGNKTKEAVNGEEVCEV